MRIQEECVLTIETAIFEYQLHRNRDSYLAEFYLSIVRGNVQRLLRNHGIRWDDAAERLMQDACMRYSPYCGVSFLSFMSQIIRQRQYQPRRKGLLDDDQLQAQSYAHNGIHHFNEHGPRPEELAVSRASKATLSAE